MQAIDSNTNRITENTMSSQPRGRPTQKADQPITAPEDEASSTIKETDTLSTFHPIPPSEQILRTPINRRIDSPFADRTNSLPTGRRPTIQRRSASTSISSDPPATPDPEIQQTDTSPRSHTLPGRSSSLNSALRRNVSYRELPLFDYAAADWEAEQEGAQAAAPQETAQDEDEDSGTQEKKCKERYIDKVRQFTRRLFSSCPDPHLSPFTPPPPSPPARDTLEDEPLTPGIMNNFTNLDNNPNNNLNPRPAPNAAQAQQMNGMNGMNNGLNGGTQWPNVGAQSDMNVLWEYIVKLSEMHETIRAQTQDVASGMQQIETMRASSSTAPSAPYTNGISTSSHRPFTTL